MSIRHGLAKDIVMAGPQQHKSPEYTQAVHAHMQANNEHDGYEHARWRDLNEKAQSLDAFAIVRNPWARVVSRYFYSQMVAFGGRTGIHKDLIVYPDQTFDNFLDERHRWGAEPYYWHRAIRGWCPALDYVTDETGAMRCEILRCEHLAEDLKTYAGWTLPPTRRNVTPDWSGKRPFTEMYDVHSRKTVADWYEADIETWGFAFATTATKGTVAQR